MFVDARSVTPDSLVRTPVVIVGGGPAGLSLAFSLERAGIPSIVLESGPMQPDSKTLALYEGDSVGLAYGIAQGYRNRYLGGNSNCWGGFCRPWDDWSFERREWVADSGWPLSAADLAPHYRDAARLLGLASDDYTAQGWVDRLQRADTVRYDLPEQDLRDGVSLMSPPVKFGEAFRERLERSRLVAVHLWANATEIETDDGAANVRALTVRTLTGNRFRIVADQFVLAAGAIENARLLLASDRVQAGGLGNGHDLVGRYFADHPRIKWGELVPTPGQYVNRLYDITFNFLAGSLGDGRSRVSGFMALPFERQREEGLLDAHVWTRSMFLGENAALRSSLARMKQRLIAGQRYGFGLGSDAWTLARQPLSVAAFTTSYLARTPRLMRKLVLEAIVEPAPDRDSRVQLSAEVDSLGMRRSRVDWRLSPQVARTFDRTFARISDLLERAGAATVRRGPSVEAEGWPADMESTWHPMGTTRMHDSPRQGVVDRDSRVHGLSNLYVAGSSVFTTCAANHPTMTLVALSLRLGAHLRDLRQGAPATIGAAAARPAGPALPTPAVGPAHHRRPLRPLAAMVRHSRQALGQTRTARAFSRSPTRHGA